MKEIKGCPYCLKVAKQVSLNRIKCAHCKAKIYIVIEGMAIDRRLMKTTSSDPSDVIGLDASSCD